MGIALLSFADLFTPLQALASRWMPARHGRRTGGAAGLRYVAVRPASATRLAAATARPAPALRVVRLVDAQAPGGSSGRMVISGRMADVCAELERLAALEAGRRLH
jgi:hypothetical protein